jgi:hypothetical protein
MPRHTSNGAGQKDAPEQKGPTNGASQPTVDDENDHSIRDTAAAAGVGMPVRRRGAAAHKMPRLESFSNLPDYLRDNEFIFGSYRPQQSPWSSLRTVWGLHNETGNVWTHLLGGSQARVVQPLGCLCGHNCMRSRNLLMKLRPWLVEDVYPCVAVPAEGGARRPPTAAVGAIAPRAPSPAHSRPST